MSGIMIGLRMVGWVSMLLPYLLCCAWPVRMRLRERPLHYRIMPAIFLTVMLVAWAHAYTSPMLTRIISVATLVLCTPLLVLCSGASLYYVLYCTLLGMNASATLALVVLDCAAGQFGVTASLLGLLASVLFSMWCLWALKRYAAPFEQPILAQRKGLLDTSPLVYLILMVVFYLDGFTLNRASPKSLLYILCMLGTWASYERNARLLRAAGANAIYQQRNGMLEHSMQLQQAQYAALTAQVAQARAARHDLRHHQRVMEQFIRDGDQARLQEYLDGFRERVDACGEEPGVCAHHAVDALVRYYLEQMAQQNAALDVALDIREDIAIPAYDLCIVIGNCMENALEAIRDTEPGKRFLRMRAEQSGQMLTLVIGNSYCGKRLRNGETFLSTKHPNEPGIGLSSIEATVARYGGNVKTQAEDGVFRISVILFWEEAWA